MGQSQSPGVAQDLVLLVRIGVGLQQVDDLANEGLLFGELLRIVPLSGSWTISLKFQYYCELYTGLFVTELMYQMS